MCLVNATDQRVRIVNIPQQAGYIRKNNEHLGFECRGQDGGSTVTIDIDNLALITQPRWTQHRRIAVIQEQRQQSSVNLLHPPGTIVAQDFTVAVLDDLDGSFTLAFHAATIGTAQANGIDAKLLQTLDKELVHLAYVRHVKNF